MNYNKLLTNMTSKVNIITLVYFLFLSLIILIFGYTPFPDSEGYLILTKDCLQHNQPYPISTQLKELPFIWNIGAINAVWVAHHLFGENGTHVLLLLYAAMKATSARLIYAIAQQLFNKKVALTTFILYIIYPANWGESTSLLSEIPFTFFALTAIWACTINATLFAGIALAIANWFRPMALIFLLPLLLAYRQQALKLVLGYVLCIGCIGGINQIRTGYFLYEAKTGWMALRQYSLDHSRQTNKQHYTHPHIHQLDCVQRDSVWRQQALQWIKDHPQEYISQMPAKFIRTYISDNIYFCAFLPNKNTLPYMYEKVSMPTLFTSFPHYESKAQWLTLLNLLYYYLLLIGFIAYTFLSLRSLLRIPLRTSSSIFNSPFLHPSRVIIIGIPLLATILLMLVGHGEARFHNPLMPFIIMATAATSHHFART